MSLLAKRKAIYFALETVYGTEAAIAGTNVIDTEELSINAIDGPTVQQNRDRPYLGGDKRIRVGTFVSLSFMVPFAAPGGAAVDVPKWAPLLEVCGFDEAEVVGATHVEMDLIKSTQDFKSGSIWFEHDGQQHKLLGCRATVNFALSPGSRPMMAFTVQGLFVSPQTVAGLTPDYTGWGQELPINEANVPTFLLHGESLVVSEFSVSQNGALNYRNVINGEEIILSDWDFVGQITFDAPEISVKDWFAASQNEDTGPLQMVIGETSGRIVQIDCADVQILITSTYEASPEGVSTLGADLYMLNTTEGKDFVVTTK